MRVIVAPGIIGEMPCVGGVAPFAGEVAIAQPHEGDGHTRTRAFALQAGENLRLVGCLGGEDQRQFDRLDVGC